MTAHDDSRLDGRLPEFAVMSLRPGIGRGAITEVGKTITRFNLVDERSDVPTSLRLGSRLFPIGRYLRGVLREEIGRDKKAVALPPQDEVLAMRLVSLEAKTDEELSVKKQLIKAGDQAVRQMYARQKIYKRGKKL